MNLIHSKILGNIRDCRIPIRTFLVESWECESAKSIDFMGFVNLGGSGYC